jgi:hypothetical protein
MMKCSKSFLVDMIKKIKSEVPLAKKHTGMMIDYSGLLNRIAGGCKVRQDQRWMLGEFSKHLQEMSFRFYSGDIAAVDELLQLYCLDNNRPDQKQDKKS